MLNKNSKEKSIAFEAIVSVLTFIVTTLLNQTHLNLSLKILLCLIFIIILLIIIKFLKINKTDINTYTSMRDNLFRVKNILDNLRRNDQSIDIIWFDELNDFINLYSSKLHNFTDKKAIGSSKSKSSVGLINICAILTFVISPPDKSPHSDSNKWVIFKPLKHRFFFYFEYFSHKITYRK